MVAGPASKPLLWPLWDSATDGVVRGKAEGEDDAKPFQDPECEK